MISGYIEGISGAGLTVVNYGSIAGTDPNSGIGAYLSSGGLVTNAASASLTGGNDGVFIKGGAEAVVNEGSIAGAPVYGASH